MKAAFILFKTDYFEQWLQEQDKETQVKIQIRLDRIAMDGHFGTTHFFDGLTELKWKSGLRVYTARIGKVIFVVLAGGTKHGQSKDIQKAKKLLKEIKARGFNSPQGS